jgi:hypothetical protein
MNLTGGKRKANKSLKAWVAFVKKVQREEKLSYKDAIMRAKQRKDKGEKWMKGGQNDGDDYTVSENSMPQDMEMEMEMGGQQDGGRRHKRRSMRRSRGRSMRRSRGRSMRRSRGRSMRRSRGRSMRRK